MRGRKITAIVLSSAIIVSGMGTVTMAEESTEVQQEVRTVQTASDSNAEKNQDTNREEKKQEVKRAGNNKEQKASPSEAGVIVTDERELINAIGSGKSTIAIEGEITLTDSLFISSGKNVYLTGGKLSCGMERPGNDSPYQMITVGENASLTLSDIEIDATGWGNDKAVSDTEKKIRCHTIMGNSGSDIVIEEGTQIYCESEEMKGKVLKRGMFLLGNCTMNGGSISGFTDGAITVNGNAKFTMNGGEIIENGNYEKKEGFLTAGAAIQGNGNIELNGGNISSNEYGVWVLGKFQMNDGDISQNEFGIYNCNTSDNLQYKPESIIRGGTVTNNETAITNLSGGTVTITGDAIVDGKLSVQKFTGYSMSKASADTTYVIRNNDNAILNINGGTITAYAANEIAVFNDSTSKLYMTDGIVTAAGTAIRNENPTVGEVKLTSGKIQLIGTEGKAIDNIGYLEATSELVVESENNNQYVVAVNHNEGGKVSPSTSVESVGKEIRFEIKPDSGYKILNVAVDDESKGAVSALDLTVEHAHEVVVEFGKIQSSSSGGSSSGSSRSSAVSSTQTIPETPGSWIQDQAGWKFINGSVPYSNIWIRKNNAWYWIGEDGYMKTGWNLISEKWYYLTPVSGEMKTGWIADGGNWYYADETGARVTGWIKTGEKWYYLNADGKMAFNTTTPDGYRVDENGAMIG